MSTPPLNTAEIPLKGLPAASTPGPEKDELLGRVKRKDGLGLLRFLQDAFTLVKPRIASFVILATAAGFYLGTPGSLQWALFFHTLLGTALLGGGGSVLNQLIERRLDARMLRTRLRPLPAGRIPTRELDLGEEIQ